MRIKYILLILVLLLIPSMGYSANCGASPDTYYVDFVGGDDTANGTADSTPWKHSPGDDSATGNAACSLQAGDTVIFKGGVIYEGHIDIDVSGSSGSLITYDGNSAGTWGTGKAIIQGAGYNGATGVDEEYGFKAAASRNYVTIQNFEIRGFGGGAVNTSCSDLHQIDGYGVFFAAGGAYITIKDCKIWDIGDWENKQYAHGGYMEGMAIYFLGTSTNITIDNIEISKCGRGGVYFVSSGSTPSVTNIEVKNCNIHDFMRWGIYFGAGANSSTFQDINIHNNTLHDFSDGSPWLGCAGAYLHQDMMMFTPNSYTGHTLGTAIHHIKVYDNLFYSATTAVVGTAEIFMTAWGGTMYIYNNVFKNPRASNGVIYGQGMSGDSPADYHIYNNSFYGNRSFVVMRDLGGVSFSGRTALNVINNVFYYNSTSSALAVQGQGIPMSYFTNINDNIFYTLRTDGLIAASLEDGVVKYKTVATLNALDNADGNIATNPLFTDITTYGLGANSSLNDLTLQSGSPAINIGTDLSAYFTTDFAGNTRPTGANSWDLGAYERGGEGDTTAPTLLSATIAANGTSLTLGFSEPVDTTINTGFAITASGGAATLTYASGTGSNSLVYTINRAIAQSETATVAYTQPGNGIEDVAGNDLASFSGSSITNNSTQGDPPVYELAITKGAGISSITSTPAGVDCGSTCSYDFDGGTAIQLSISCVNEGWYVSSITGDCASDGSVTMSAAKACTIACSEVKLNTFCR